MRISQTCYRIDQQKHLFARIPEVFGHGHRCGRAAASLRRRLVRSRDDHHGTFHAGRTHHTFDEIPHLSRPLANQGDHDHIRLDSLAQLAKQRRFPDA